jgi:hypothetical protein
VLTARLVLSERAYGDHKSPHLKLIEELCQEGDRLSEEARKERDDLQQQARIFYDSYVWIVSASMYGQ